LSNSRIAFSENEIRAYYTPRVPKLHQCGGELRGPCPRHNGKKDSFAVNLETGEWYCHSACGRGGSIFDFEMMSSGTAFPTARNEVLRAVGRPVKEIVATYDYRDEQDQLLYQCVRYVPKDFKQRRPDGRGGWIWNLKGVRKVLYKLTLVIKAETVFICEGEKDADALCALGVVATTSPLGAGKWRTEYSEFLRGKRVFVIPDADEKGRQHAADILRSLEGVAASAKLVELPPGAKDVSEWIDLGGTLVQLKELAERAEAAPAPPPPEEKKLPSGPELLSAVEKLIRRYVVLPAVAYLVVALWAIATHAVQQFDCYPYLALVSAVKRSGKTRLAEVLELLVRLPWRGTAPSPAAVYRMLEGAPTLLWDESEALKGGKNQSETTKILLAVLNAGHRKGTTIPRCEAPKWEVRLFETYGPKMFAAIGRLPDTLTDRSILVQMKRRTRAQPIERFRQVRAKAQAEPIKDDVMRFVEACRGSIEEAYQQVLDMDTEFEYLNDRDADLWTPLFAICSVVDSARLPDLKTSAKTLSGIKASEDVDDSYVLSLLRDIRTVWPKKPGAPDPEDKCETAVLLKELKALEESPWGEPQFDARKLARMLRPFGVEPRNIRVDEKNDSSTSGAGGAEAQQVLRGYWYAELEAAISLYLADLSATCATSQ
jgi:hypothetical protein